MKGLVSMPRLKGFRFPREIVACAVGPVAGLPRALPMRRTCSPGAASLSVGKAFDTGSTDLARPLPTASGGSDKWHPDEAVS